jgi:hypothetical protein
MQAEVVDDSEASVLSSRGLQPETAHVGFLFELLHPNAGSRSILHPLSSPRFKLGGPRIVVPQARGPHSKQSNGPSIDDESLQKGAGGGQSQL